MLKNKLLLPRIFFSILNKYSPQGFIDFFYMWYERYVEYIGIKIILKQDIIESHALNSNYLVIEDCILFKNGIIKTNKNEIMLNNSYELYAVLANLRNVCNKKIQTQLKGNYVSLGYIYDDVFQYFHFIMDNFKNLISYREYLPENINFISTRLPTQFENQFYSLIDIDKVSKQNCACSVERLYLSKSTKRWDKNNFKELRHLILDKNPIINKKSLRKVFISRIGEKRAFSNQRYFEDYMQTLGFEVIDFKKLNLQNRINLLQNTSLLVGQYGAGLTNSIFLNKNATVLEIQPGNWVRDDYQLLCKMIDINYFSLPLPIRSFDWYSHKFTTDDFRRLIITLGIID